MRNFICLLLTTGLGVLLAIGLIAIGYNLLQQYPQCNYVDSI